MFRVALLFIWFITISVHPMPMPRSVFGVKVSIGANSQLTSFVCYINNGRVLSKKQIVDKETFVKIVSGYWPSIYNPKGLNLFKENGIDCAFVEDPETYEKGVDCQPLDSLWKIRFSTYPYQHRTDLGWSNKYHKPSPGQEKYLYERYGIAHIDGDYFLDTNFWKILRDVSDPQWVANYKSIR